MDKEKNYMPILERKDDQTQTLGQVYHSIWRIHNRKTMHPNSGSLDGQQTQDDQPCRACTTMYIT